MVQLPEPHRPNRRPRLAEDGLHLGFFDEKVPDAKNSYRRFVEDLMKSEYESPLKATVASTVLGRPEFVREVSEKRLGEKRAERSQPAVKQLARRPSMDEIIMQVNAVFIEREDLLRNASIYYCQK